MSGRIRNNRFRPWASLAQQGLPDEEKPSPFLTGFFYYINWVEIYSIQEISAHGAT